MKKVLFIFLMLLVSGLFVSTQSHAAIIIPPASSSKVIAPDPAIVKSAVADYKNLSRKERKEKLKEVKSEIKKFKASKKAGKDPETNKLLLVILAILLPPLAVYLHQGEANNKFWISLILTLLLWIPGVVYALIVVLGADE